MIVIDDEIINELFIGDIGIQSACVGNEELDKRVGSFFYLYLQVEPKGDNQ